MSYLIALYVYYHGNNLHAYGIIKGMKEEKPKNEGLSYEDVQFAHVIPQHDIEIMKNQAKVREENDYEKMMRVAILNSQQESLMMRQKGLVQNSVLDNTSSDILEDVYAGTGEIDMSFFDKINNF